MRLLLLILVAALAHAADFRAGVARRQLTDGTADHPPRFAKALAFDDGKGGRAVIVTTDAVRLNRAISDVAAARIMQQYGLERSELLLSSPPDSPPAPAASSPLVLAFSSHQKNGGNAQQWTDDLVGVAGEALASLQPADVSFGSGNVGFATRQTGPTNHGLPILRVTARDNKLLAVLFGDAGHHATEPGDDAAIAQAEIERTHPGASALFLPLCGSDAETGPHDQILAAEVTRILATKMTPVRGPIHSAYQTADLALRVRTHAQLEEQAKSSNPSIARLVQALLTNLSGRDIPHSVLYPVQAIHFGKDFTLVALGGDVAVDYAIRIRSEFPQERLFIANGANDVMAYIPSMRQLQRTSSSNLVDERTLAYGLPAPFTDDIESSVIALIRQVLLRAGVKPKI